MRTIEIVEQKKVDKKIIKSSPSLFRLFHSLSLSFASDWMKKKRKLFRERDHINIITRDTINTHTHILSLLLFLFSFITITLIFIFHLSLVFHIIFLINTLTTTRRPMRIELNKRGRGKSSLLYSYIFCVFSLIQYKRVCDSVFYFYYERLSLEFSILAKIIN